MWIVDTGMKCKRRVLLKYNYYANKYFLITIYTDQNDGGGQKMIALSIDRIFTDLKPQYI